MVAATTQPTMDKKKALWLLGIIIFSALCLRLPGLSYSFYGDEWFSVVRDSNQLITDTEDRFRPLFFSLLYLWKQIGFSGEVGLRLLPLIFGLLQVPLAYAVGRDLRNRNYGLLFAGLVALSPILIEFSQELRMYSIIGCLALLQVWLFLYLIRGPSLSVWFSFVLVSLAGVYTHLFYWVFLMGISLSLFRVRSSIPLWKSFAALMTVLLLYLPNLINLARFAERRGGDYVIHLPSALPKLLAAFTVGFNYFSLPDLGRARMIGWQTLYDNRLLLLPVVIAGSILLWGFIQAHRKHNRTADLWMAHELFTVPVLIAAFASAATGQYFLQPKYLIFSAPFVFLLILDSGLLLKSIRLRQIVAVMGIAIFMIAYTHYSNPEEYGRKENWREAARFLSNSINEKSGILLLSNGYMLSYYAPELKSAFIDLAESQSPLTANSLDPVRLRKQLIGKQTLFYVYWDTIQNLKDPDNYLITALDRLTGEHTVYSLNPRLKIYIWKMPPPIPVESH
jgi:uncharacterized membrane protein